MHLQLVLGADLHPRDGATVAPAFLTPDIGHHALRKHGSGPRGPEPLSYLLLAGTLARSASIFARASSVMVSAA